jgi:hypothetical protein
MIKLPPDLIPPLFLPVSIADQIRYMRRRLARSQGRPGKPIGLQVNGPNDATFFVKSLIRPPATPQWIDLNIDAEKT